MDAGHSQAVRMLVRATTRRTELDVLLAAALQIDALHSFWVVAADEVDDISHRARLEDEKMQVAAELGRVD
jgi:hypothetical protein